MTQWLKTILGDGYTGEIEKKISEKIGKSFVSRADFNRLSESKKALEAAVAERDTQLCNVQKNGAQELREEIARLKDENAAAREQYEQSLADVQFTSALDQELTQAKPRSLKAVKSLLDMDSLKWNDGRIAGLSDQLERLREQNDYLFEPDFALGAVAGTGGRGGAVRLSDMTYSEQMAYMETHQNIQI